MIWRQATSYTRDSDFCACCGLLLQFPGFPWKEAVLRQTQTSSFLHWWNALLISSYHVICWSESSRYSANHFNVGFTALFVVNEDSSTLSQPSPASPRSLLELQFACFEGISRSSRGNCACRQRWQTWRRRGGGWSHWRRHLCWSRPGCTCPGSSEARSEVQSSKWAPKLETALHRAPEIQDLEWHFSSALNRIAPTRKFVSFQVNSQQSTHNLTAKCGRWTGNFALADHTAPASSSGSDLLILEFTWPLRFFLR